MSNIFLLDYGMNSTELELVLYFMNYFNSPHPSSAYMHNCESLMPKLSYHLKHLLSISSLDGYILDVFWGQPIKLAQVASTSGLCENQ